MIVLTGAGLSAPSGLPVFRGEEGIYTKGFGDPGQFKSPIEILTMKNFHKFPEILWKWHFTVMHKTLKAKPDDGHKMIHDLQAKF